MKLTVIIPVYNEKKTIQKAIEEAKNLHIEKEIIVVDNSSTDGTKEILKNLKDDSIKIIFQPQNHGYGQSVITGASLAKGEFIYTHQSDLEYDIECVYRMLDISEKKNLDYVLGSRLYKKTSSASIFSLVKKRPYYLGTIISTFLINLLYRSNFTDIIGTRLYRASSFRKVNIKSRGNHFDFEVASKFCKVGFKIEEVPVSYKPRGKKEGKKVKPIVIIPAIIAIFKVKFFDKNELK